jgi:hypothetical protein
MGLETIYEDAKISSIISIFFTFNYFKLRPGVSKKKRYEIKLTILKKPLLLSIT